MSFITQPLVYIGFRPKTKNELLEWSERVRGAVEMSCPKCNGEKVLHGLGCPGGRIVQINCFQCKGTGDLTAEQWEWYQEGQKLADWRRSRDLSCREEAKRRNMRPIELTDMEQGRIKPIWPDTPPGGSG